MGAKTKTVGGGTATPVANEWNNFLMQQLRGGGGAAQPSIADPSFLQQFDRNNPNTSFANYARQQQNNAAQPGAQSQNAFGNAMNNALTGQVRDISGAGGALQNFFGDTSQNRLNTNFANTFTAPTYNAPTLSQLPSNFGAGQTGMANLSNFGNASQANFDTQRGFGSMGTSTFTPGLQNAISGMNNLQQAAASQASVGGPQSIGARPELSQGMDWRTAFNTMGEDPMQRRIEDRAAADMRARFGAEGAGALGTGAQFAEGNLRAELAAQDASKRRMEALQLMQQDLNERSTGANVALQGRGQDSQYNLGNRGIDANVAMQNAQLGTQASLANASNALAGRSAGLQALLGARGQDFTNQATNRGLDVNQLGMGSQQSMFNAGQNNAMQQAMINATLQNQGLGNQFGLGAAQLNNAAMQSNNLNNINTSQFQNQFNQNNSQLGAQFGLGANQLNSQNQGMNNQFLANMIGQGLNLNQMGNQNTNSILAQLFGAFGQSNALGTPQAQIIQQPSMWGQLANMGMNLAGNWLAGGGGNPFGGGGGGFNPGGVPGGGWGSQGSGWTRGIPGGTYSGPSWG